VGSGGDVTPFGDAPFYGQAADLGSPIISIVSSRTGRGYWLVTQDGRVLPYGDARPATRTPGGPVVAAARAGAGDGLWLASADGAVVSPNGAAVFGPAAAGARPTKPVTAIVSSRTGRGYWLVAQDGQVLPYGDARPVTGLPTLPPAQPIVAATRAGDTDGLWLTSAGGAVYALNGAPARAAADGLQPDTPVSGIAGDPAGGGYWLVARDGEVVAHGAGFFGSASAIPCLPRMRAAFGPINTLPKVVSIAQSIRNGKAQVPWKGGKVPYSWGGGHARQPGPSKGTCTGYHGAIHPCPANKTVGVDCSGFARWVYHLAFGSDVLGAGNTNGEVVRLTRVTAATAQPGDLVYFGTATPHALNTHHVGIYIGKGQMINAARTGTYIRIDKLATHHDLAGYFHYDDIPAT
jgi:hypothetical protein